MIDPMVIAGVQMIIKEMDDQEVVTQRLAALLGNSHAGKYGYEKIKPLLTQDNGTKMHSDTEAAFLALSKARLGL